MKTSRKSVKKFPLTAGSLKKLAGETYWERGLKYYNAGTVTRLALNDNGITARVQGTADSPYLVRFWLKKNKLQWGCACPLGAGGEFCKHLVATGLTWIHEGEVSGPEETGDDTASENRDESLPDLRAVLARIDRKTLAEMILHRAEWDDYLREEIYLMAESIK